MTSGLLTATDAAGVVRAALAAATAAECGVPLSVAAALGAHMSSLVEEGSSTAGPTAAAPAGGASQQQQQQPQQLEDDLQDLDELALMVSGCVTLCFFCNLLLAQSLCASNYSFPAH